jgi:hypothetical protein
MWNDNKHVEQKQTDVERKQSCQTKVNNWIESKLMWNESQLVKRKQTDVERKRICGTKANMWNKRQHVE